MTEYKTVEIVRGAVMNRTRTDDFDVIRISDPMPYRLRDIPNTKCHIKKEPPKPWGKKGRRQQKWGSQ